MDAGIDYGFGKTNVDLETGIRYGVIPNHRLAWIEDFEPFYGTEEELSEVSEEEFEFFDPVCWILEAAEYQAQMGDVDTFIFKSPYYTLAQFCSPCAPGAGYILNHTSEGVKAYCFGHDFFAEGVAPYPVYSVETGKLVSP